MAASPGFFVFFFSGHFQIHSNLEIRFSCGVYWEMLHRRISVYADCTPNQPARVVKPHGKHAQDTEGELRGEFQPRRKLHIRQFRKYAGRLCSVGRF